MKIYFVHAEWCSPCKLMEKKLEQLTNGGIEFDLVEIDVDKNIEFCRKNNITHIPTLIVEKDDKKIKIVGNKTLDEIKELIQNG